jgi:hypothetical protein
MKHQIHWVVLGGLLLAAPPRWAAAASTTTTTTLRASTTTTLPDADGDGVPDARDRCPATPRGEIVNRDGCSIAQLCPCDAPRGASAWKSHGQYVSCFRHAVNAFRKATLLTKLQAQDAMQSAAKTQCGVKAPGPRHGRTRCCRRHAGVAARAFCLEVSKRACAKQQGVNMGVGSCLPNPCL